MPRVPAIQSPGSSPPSTPRTLADTPPDPSRTATKTATKQDTRFRFLDLPAEIRLMCYPYLLPTVDEPHLLVYNPRVDTQKQTFLALWRSCKKIYNELPTISSLLSAGAIIPTIEVGRGTLSSTGSWEEEPSKETSPALWEPILSYLMPFLPEARYLHICYPGLGENERWLEEWKKSEIARSAMEEWLWVHFDDFSEVVDEDENEDADGHPSQGKTLLLDLEIASRSHIPYLYVSLYPHAVFNLDVITLPKVELLEEKSRTAAEKAAREQTPEYYKECDREYYESTLESLNKKEERNLEKLKIMHKDFEPFRLFSVDFHEDGGFHGTIGKWSADGRRFVREYAVETRPLR
ncbi:hypothetical protein MMC10_009839 [Thelotrema lepadinum]|nr:hypothetical protein [Thelotrema lepadinum]